MTSIVFDTLEPHAKGLWRHEISDFASAAEGFTWRKQTYFGGLYQKTVARRLAVPAEEPEECRHRSRHTHRPAG